jgi:hypothetical protein
VKNKIIIDGMSINGIELILRDDKGNELKRTCPQCGKKSIISRFGLRAMDNKTVRLQPWCIPCRGGR